MGAAGLLLTGGWSRRMGRDKATIASGAAEEGPSFAERAARMLLACTGPAVEVGPGHSGLRSVSEDPPGRGPLAALAAGGAELRRIGWVGPAVVIATDMPRIEPPLLEWLVGYPGDRSVVPVVGGRPQPLCARYSCEALEAALSLSNAGATALRDLLATVNPVLAGPDEWEPAGIDPSWFADIDTPEELAAYRTGMA